MSTHTGRRIRTIDERVEAFGRAADLAARAAADLAASIADRPDSQQTGRGLRRVADKPPAALVELEALLSDEGNDVHK